MTSADTIDRIARFRGGKLPVVSVYAALAPSSDARRTLRSKADSLLHQIRDLGEQRSLDHTARQSLQQDIARVQEAVAHQLPRPGAMAIFSCSRGGLFEVVRLPQAMRDRIVVDETPWSRPMLAVLDEYPRCCVAILDQKQAHAYELYLGELRDAGKLNGNARHPTYGLWDEGSEYHLNNRLEELAKRQFRGVAAALDELFRTDRYDVLAVGGHAHELSTFLGFLPRPLRDRVIGTFSIDPGTATKATIRQQAATVLDRYELQEQERLVAEVMERAAAGGRAALGLEQCLWAGSTAAVQMLLVQQDAVAPGVVCDESGWLAAAGDTCPLCGRQTRRTPDVIDELVEAVIDEGGAIRHVRVEGALGKHRIAASLRFPLPPLPDPNAGARQ